MPVSTLDPAALARLTPQQLADLALAADQDARRSRARGDVTAAADHASERDNLAALFLAK